ncbi:MAG: VOC family protein, partial [Pseudonocardiales bacterium]|nr:VOC family protein [Pseudonocardiales bacterium]
MIGLPNARPSLSSAVTVSKVGYVGFQTPDVARLVEYYTRVLDFVVVDSDPDRAYLTTGFDHHCIVIERGVT